MRYAIWWLYVFLRIEQLFLVKILSVERVWMNQVEKNFRARKVGQVVARVHGMNRENQCWFLESLTGWEQVGLERGHGARPNSDFQVIWGKCNLWPCLSGAGGFLKAFWTLSTGGVHLTLKAWLLRSKTRIPKIRPLKCLSHNWQHYIALIHIPPTQSWC